MKSSTFETLPYVFLMHKPEDDKTYYKILGLFKGKRQFRWIQAEYMTPRYPDDNNINSFKVMLPEANGNGTFGETLSAPLVAGPMESSTPSFISIGKFGERIEAENALKYMKTKFLRALLGILKKTSIVRLQIGPTFLFKISLPPINCTRNMV